MELLFFCFAVFCTAVPIPWQGQWQGQHGQRLWTLSEQDINPVLSLLTSMGKIAPLGYLRGIIEAQPALQQQLSDFVTLAAKSRIGRDAGDFVRQGGAMHGWEVSKMPAIGTSYILLGCIASTLDHSVTESLVMIDVGVEMIHARRAPFTDSIMSTTDIIGTGFFSQTLQLVEGSINVEVAAEETVRQTCQWFRSLSSDQRGNHEEGEDLAFRMDVFCRA